MNPNKTVILIWNGDVNFRTTQIFQSFKTLSETIRLWHQRYNQRRELLKLDEVNLDDIGITRSQAIKEAGKPFWKK